MSLTCTKRMCKCIFNFKKKTWVLYFHSQFYKKGFEKSIKYNDPKFILIGQINQKLFQKKIIDKIFIMKILISGGSGFIGKNLVNYLIKKNMNIM
jgi:hypothetical protein